VNGFALKRKSGTENARPDNRAHRERENTYSRQAGSFEVSRLLGTVTLIAWVSDPDGSPIQIVQHL
jgi:hypothetical protein